MKLKNSKLKKVVWRAAERGKRLWQYVSGGVWSDTRNTWWVKAVKMGNLSVRSFMDSDLQGQAAAMTFRTLLAIVPALALLLAIGRGFGLSDFIQTQLYQFFPAQHTAIDTGMTFVDSYLNQMTGGVFVGVGIVFLLWTLISLVSNVEKVFNKVWGVKKGRPLWRQITDYTAMLLILPVLMICAGGLQLFVSSALRTILHFAFLSPLVEWLLSLASFAMTWVFFAAVYKLIPNTVVKFKYALVAGIVSGTAFLALQWVFVTGQMYVSKYNAIYGSFSFLPLLLIWMQLAWLITMSGAVICYSLQNFSRFNYDNKTGSISINYRECITLSMMAVVVQRFEKGLKPPAAADFVTRYNVPPRIADEELARLEEAHLVNRVYLDDDDPDTAAGYAPASDPQHLTVQKVRTALRALGSSNFIPRFDKNFKDVIDVVRDIDIQISHSEVGDMLLTDLNVKL